MPNQAFVGQAAVPAAATKLSTLFPTLKGGSDVFLKSMKANVGGIFLGIDNTVTITNGFELANTDQATRLEAYGNPKDLWVISTNGTDRLCILNLTN